jgi:CheY-like chemotaxis protein
MSWEREQCAAAGMDDFVPKPVRAEHLAETLARWVPRAAEPLDRAALAELRDDDPDAFAELVPLFRDSAEASLARLRDAVAGEDRATLLAAAHALKGSSASMGAGQVARRCAELESAAGDWPRARALVRELEAEVRRAVAALHAPLLEAPAPGNRGLVPPKAGGTGAAGETGAAEATETLAPVLVVEDDPVAAALVRRHLADLGLANPVHVIDDGDEAVAWLADRMAERPEAPPALVLLDYHLPGRSGLDVLRWAHAQPGLRAVPVLLLAGHSDVEGISEAHALGARSYLVKPVGFGALREVVRGLDLRWAILPVDRPPA